MNSENDKAKELERRARELQEREQAIRLRELEAEINQPPLYQTQKHQQPEGRLKRWKRKLVNLGKFLVVVATVVITIRIAYWLAIGIIVGGLAWLGYEIFWKDDHS